MKNICAILILFFLSFGLAAQDLDYFSFEPKWRVDHLSGGFHCYPNIQLSYYLDGDTVMTNGLTYKKVFNKVLVHYIQFMEPTPCDEDIYWEEYAVSIRQEGNKMFEWDGLQDTLLYDFNLSIGDTLQSSALFNANLDEPVVVQAIDSIETNMGWHNRYWFNYNNSDIEYIIEGIGHDRGFLESMGLLVNGSSRLVCYGQLDEPILETGQNCEFSISTKEHSPGVLALFPNPSDGIVRITLPTGQHSRIMEFIVIDSKGQTIIRDIGSIQDFETLDTSDWTNGIYFIILSADGDYYTNRLIVK